MENAIKNNADTDKVGVSEDETVYVVVTDCTRDNICYCEGVFLSLEEAKECQRKADAENEEFFGGYVPTTIWVQSLHRKKVS